MPVWKASFVVPYEAAEVFCETLESAPDPELLAISTVEANEAPSPLVRTASEWNEVEAHGMWRVEALYAEEPEVKSLHMLLAHAERETGHGFIHFRMEQLPDIDWVAKSLEGLDPVRAGRFFIYGGHDAEKIPGGCIPIRVEANQAFGTGHHQTTSGCLEYISETLGAGVPVNALDIGTGTGVLAIAIAKIARCKVLASDIDPVAADVANRNARINGAASFVRAVQAAGFGHPGLRAQAPYDLIVANILARPLVSLAPSFRAHLRPGGTLILSGILNRQENMVVSACRAQGLYLVSRKRKGDWVTLKLKG